MGEVYVKDEDECGWLLGKPQSRVTDAHGHDAYLCVEYNWDGDDYQEDFDPKTVRKPGTSQTVWQILMDEDLARFKRVSELSSPPLKEEDDDDKAVILPG